MHRSMWLSAESNYLFSLYIYMHAYLLCAVNHVHEPKGCPKKYAMKIALQCNTYCACCGLK